MCKLNFKNCSTVADLQFHLHHFCAKNPPKILKQVQDGRWGLGQGRPKGLRQCFGCHIVAGTFLWHGGHIAFCGPAQCVTGIAKCGKKVPKGSCSCGWGYRPPPQRIWASILNTPQPQGYCCGGWAAPQLWGAHIYRHHPNCAMPIIKVFKL